MGLNQKGGPVREKTLPSTAAVTTQGSEPFLVIDGVSKVYPTANGPYTVLDDVHLEVREGEFICVIGHSGCGKSTLLDMVSGFREPTTRATPTAT